MRNKKDRHLFTLIKKQRENIPITKIRNAIGDIVVVVQSLSLFQIFVTPWTAGHQVHLFFSISQGLLRFMSIESVMLSNHLILIPSLLLLPSIFPSIRVFSRVDSHIRRPKYWSFSVSPYNEYPEMISFRIDWFDLLDHNLKHQFFSAQSSLWSNSHIHT